MAVSNLGIAVAFAIGAASFHAIAAVTQNRLAVRLAAGSRPLPEVPPSTTRRQRTGNLAMMTEHRWWFAIGMTLTATALHVCALNFGPLTVVQPLGVLSLAFALTISAALFGRQVTPTEWRGMAMSMAGLACLLLLTAPGRPRHGLSTTQVVTLSAVTVVVVTAVIVAAVRMPRPVRRSLLYALAAGLTFGVSSALTQTVTTRVADDGAQAAVSPTTAVVIVFAVAGLLLAQTAFRGGLGAPMATATIVNPVVAGAIGIGLLGERFTGGPAAVTAAVAAAVVAGSGVVLLARGGRSAVSRPARRQQVPVHS